jgi:DNA-binding beta-propeller fold protein YncE
MRTRRWIAVAALCFVAVGCGGEAETEPPVKLTELWTAGGAFRSPEAAAFDEARQVIYITNLNGYERNGEGYISVLAPDGEVLEPKWIEGLDAPTGIVVANESLYVADIDRLVSISIPEEKIVSVYAAGDSAPELRAVAADPSGEIYVVGSASATIYRLWEGGLSVWFSDPEVRRPKGLSLDGQNAWVAANFLRGISVLDGSMTALGTDSTLFNLESIDSDEHGGFFITAGGTQPIYHLTAEGEITTLLERDVYSRDVEYIDMLRLLIVPSGGDQVVAYEVERAG